jgi:restriction endonuclease S subunit
MKREVWKKKELGNIGVFKNGLNKPIENFGHGTKFVNISDVYLPELDINGLGRVETLPQDLLIYKLEKNDLLFVRSSVKPDGIGYTTIFKGSNEIIVYCGFIIRYRLFDRNLNPDLLNLILRSITYRRKIIAASTVSANTNVNQSTLSKITVLYPNKSTEQSRIASIISSCDDTIRTTLAVIDKYKAVKQGMMRDLFTRGLAADGTLRPSYEQQPELYKPSELGMIPKEWDVKQLGKCAEVNRGGSPRPIEKYITDSEDGINWIKIGDVKPNSKYITSTIEKIIPAGLLATRRVKTGDFLLSNSMSFGRPYIIKIDGAIHDGWLTIQNYEQNFNIDYLYYLLSSDDIKKQYSKYAAGSTVLNLNKEIVKKVFVVITNPLEQHAIADRLSAIDAAISSEEALLAKYQAVKQGLMDRLLTPPEDAIIEDETEGDLK